VATGRHSGTLGGVDPEGDETNDAGMPHLVVGSKGIDALKGGPLADTLWAAAGKMTMTGGGGRDAFVFDADLLKGRGNTAVITDFEVSKDKLQFTGNPAIVKSSDHHGGTYLDAGYVRVDLLHVNPADVHVNSCDFIV
jgi:peroxidase